MYIPEHTIPPTSHTAWVPQWHRSRPSACHIRISNIYINFVCSQCSPVGKEPWNVLECFLTLVSRCLKPVCLKDRSKRWASLILEGEKKRKAVWIWCFCIAQSSALQFVLEKGFHEQRKMCLLRILAPLAVCVLVPGAEVTCTAITPDFVALSVLLWKSRVQFWFNMKGFPLMMEMMGVFVLSLEGSKWFIAICLLLTKNDHGKCSFHLNSKSLQLFSPAVKQWWIN